MTPRQLIALSAVAAIWGGSFLFVRVLINAGVEPLGVSAGRVCFGLVGLIPFAFIARRRFPRSWRTLAAIAALGVTNFALPWSFNAFGQRDIPSGVASIANASMPLWTAIFSTALIKGDHLGRGRIAGLFLGFSGVVVLALNDTGGLGSHSTRGLAFVVTATMCYGISSVSIRRWLREVPAIPLTVGQIGVAAVILMPLALASGAYDHASLGANEWASFLALGLAGSGFTVVIYMWLINQVGAVRASVVTYLLPPIGVFLGWLVLDESVGWDLFAGLGLIVGGVALVQGAPLAKALARAGRSPAPAPSAAD
ncbi:MAG: DMT family transporter [Chloroflexi bacterium]|nr:DMT family transporter [Chloroflexota bacterium]